MRYRRAHLFRLVRTVCMSFVATFVCVNVLLNVWWLIDCDYCVGHYCGKSVCQDHRERCANKCYRDNQIDDKPVLLKHSITSTPFIFAAERVIYWQRLDLYSHADPIYVYSAFHSAHDNNVVIIGKAYYGHKETGKKFDHQFDCVFLDDGDVSLYTASDKFTNFDDHFDNFETTRITCQLSTLHVIRPNYVKLVDRTEAVKSDAIAIEYQKSENRTREPEIVVCVRPLFDGYSSVRDLLEFIAFYRVNGVNKFVFYKESASDQVMQLLGSMSDFIDVYPWTLKEGRVEARHEDQISSIDDCLHRYRQHIIIFIDIDEFIVPFSHTKLKDLVFDHQNRHSIALSVRNVFFCCEFNEHNSKDFPRILSHFNRQSSVWVRGKRSKVIALRPDLIDRMGIHEVQSVMADQSLSAVKYVHRDDALMFHYRSCCSVDRTPLLWSAVSIKTLKDRIEYDTRIYRFGDHMIDFITNYIDFDLG